MPNLKSAQAGSIHVETVTVASGATLSSAINLTNRKIVGILFPSALTGIALTFQVSDTLAGTYVAANRATADISLAKQNSKYVVLDDTTHSTEALGPYLKLDTGAAEASARTFVVYTTLRT